MSAVPGAAGFARLLNALQLAGCKFTKRTATSARCQCPAHPDNNPSLSVDLKGIVLLKCFAGCRAIAVLAKVGLQFSDLYDAPPPIAPAEEQQTVAEYYYQDADCDAYARKLRHAPRKDFSWQRMTASGWKNKLKGISPSLYGLELLAEVKQVFVTEGEKDAETLRKCGAVAVCGPYGASTWRPKWSELLWRNGAVEIIVVAHNDSAGDAYASAVALSCHAWNPPISESVSDDPWPDVVLAATDPEACKLIVKIVKLPGLAYREDVSDWFAKYQRSVEEFQKIVQAAPYWKPVDKLERIRTQGRIRQKRFRERQRQARLSPAEPQGPDTAPEPSPVIPTEHCHFVHTERYALAHTERYMLSDGLSTESAEPDADVPYTESGAGHPASRATPVSARSQGQLAFNWSDGGSLPE